MTNVEYMRFVSDYHYHHPAYIYSQGPAPYKVNHPVEMVKWNDAKMFCEWAGLRLPTSEEWEKAARGTDGRRWPWGDYWLNGYCNSIESHIEDTTPVGHFSPHGDSPYGCADMAGNVWEWTSSKTLVSDRRGVRNLRGGSYNDGSDDARTSYAFFDQAEDHSTFWFGFRVVEVLS